MMRRKNFLDPDDLNQFTDSKQWHEFSTLTPDALLSDCALWVAEEGDVFWFFDIVGLFQSINDEYNQEIFQHWIVKFEESGIVTIKCEDGNNNFIYSQVKPNEIFPFRSFDLYAAVNKDGKIKLMVPGEYK